MTLSPTQWIAALDPGIGWETAYQTVEDEARDYLFANQRVHTSVELIEGLYPAKFAVSQIAKDTRGRMYRALAKRAEHGMADVAARGAARRGAFGRVIYPWLWHDQRVKVAVGAAYEKPVQARKLCPACGGTGAVPGA